MHKKDRAQLVKQQQDRIAKMCNNQRTTYERAFEERNLEIEALKEK